MSVRSTDSDSVSLLRCRSSIKNRSVRQTATVSRHPRWDGSIKNRSSTTRRYRFCQAFFKSGRRQTCRSDSVSLLRLVPPKPCAKADVAAQSKIDQGCPTRQPRQLETRRYGRQTCRSDSVSLLRCRSSIKHDLSLQVAFDGVGTDTRESVAADTAFFAEYDDFLISFAIV